MKTNKMLPDSSINKIWDRFNKMNGSIISFLPANWVEQTDGTFTNTITHPGFTTDMVLEVDLYNDGNLTEIQITEYDSYITEFNVEDGKLVAVATIKPTQIIKILARGEFAIDTVDSRLVNENNETFNFGVKDGVRGFFIDPSRADDSFIPFKSDDGGEEYRVQVVNRLKNTNVGITDDSSWEEIFEAMKTLFPSTYDVLANLAKADWSLTGGETFTWAQSSIVLSCSTTLGYKQAQSKPINVSGFSKLSYSWSAGDSHGTQKVQLVHTGGTLNVPAGTGTLDVSSIVGEAYFILYAKSEKYTANATLHYSSAKTTVTTLKFSE